MQKGTQMFSLSLILLNYVQSDLIFIRYWRVTVNRPVSMKHLETLMIYFPYRVIKINFPMLYV